MSGTHETSRKHEDRVAAFESFEFTSLSPKSAVSKNYMHVSEMTGLVLTTKKPT